MKKIKTALCSASILVACQMANASLVVNSSVGGSAIAFMNYVNFDNLSLGSSGGTATGPSGSVNVSYVTDAQTVQYSDGVQGHYSAPYVSGGNNTFFGSAYTGSDTTPYLTTGITPGSVTLTFGSGQNYLGLLWGSVDDYNTLNFYSGNTLVGTLTGSDVLAVPPTPNTGIGGTVYANIYSSDLFDKVVASSTRYAFEFDNVAYGVVPEPSTVVAGALLLMPFGISTIRILRRKLVA